MSTAYINIGSNKGDRMALIERAVALISEKISSDFRRSSFIETEAWGFSSENRFLNLGLIVEYDSDRFTPVQLLDELLSIEASISPLSHRDSDGKYIDRFIDIDLIFINNLIIQSPKLTVPHPRMEDRLFVIRPLCELMPDWRHPVSGLTAKQILNNF